MVRSDGRSNNQLRNTHIQTGVQAFAEGSVIIDTGQTRVLCAVSVENGVPRFLQGSGQGCQYGNGLWNDKFSARFFHGFYFWHKGKDEKDFTHFTNFLF